MSLSAVVASRKRKGALEAREREQLVQFFRMIQEAAYDGQNGSASYALDRLALIQAVATSAIHKLED